MTNLHERIDELEQRFTAIEPDLRAFVPENGRFDRLRNDAADLERRFPEPGARPPLYGLLAGIKDIFHADGFPTRAGSRLPTDALSGPEADAVALLKSQGALIVGKTITTEFAYFAPGPTRNPHNPAHTPGGSSSGSAAASAAGLADITLGTQTIGSVNRPAAFCGTFGFKPSRERVSRRGVIPLACSFDHVGFFTHAPDLLEPTASILCRGWQTARSNPRLKLGVPRGPYLEPLDSDGAGHFREVRTRLKDSRWDLVEIDFLTDFEDIRARHQRILAYEAARVHAAYRQYHHLYDEKTLELIARGQEISGADYARDKEALSGFRVNVRAFMQTHRIDAWLTPAAPGAAPKGLASTGDPIMNLPWTQAGLPSLTLPSGQTAEGLPLGTQIVGHWYRDERLIKLGVEMWNAFM